MPREFTDCADSGGRIRTVNPKRGSYVKLCFDSKGSHAGETHKTQQPTKRKPYGK